MFETGWLNGARWCCRTYSINIVCEIRFIISDMILGRKTDLIHRDHYLTSCAQLGKGIKREKCGAGGRYDCGYEAEVRRGRTK